MDRKGGVFKELMAVEAGKLVTVLCPVHPSRNKSSANACSLSSRPTGEPDSSGLFAMPETLLQCCHGEVTVVLLATSYPGELQTARPGPVSDGSGATCRPHTALPTLSFIFSHSLTHTTT